MINRLLFCFLAAFAVFALLGGGPRRAVVTPSISANPPSAMYDRELWIREDNLRMYTYFDSLGVLLGEEITVLATHANANHSGFMRMGANATAAVAPGEQGFYADKVYRIMSVQAISADIFSTAACSTFLLSDADTVATLVWSTNHEEWVPGGSGWISGADRVVVDSGDVFSLTTGAGGTELPDYPNMWIRLREEETLSP